MTALTSAIRIPHCHVATATRRAATAHIADLESAHLRLTAARAQQQAQLAAAGARVPGLEADKKLAVGGRNFKEAARCSAEVRWLWLRHW
jgi:hypothetical protein